MPVAYIMLIPIPRVSRVPLHGTVHSGQESLPNHTMMPLYLHCFIGVKFNYNTRPIRLIVAQIVNMIYRDFKIVKAMDTVYIRCSQALK